MTKILSILSSFAFFLLPIAEASHPSKGIVVTANKYASEAAAQIIKKGGTALDAAITAQLILTMTTPQSTGIGGGGFMLYWDNANSKLYAIDGREVAPLSANPDLFKDQKNNILKFYPDAVISGKSVGVPGLIKLMEETHKRFGKLNWEDLFIEPIKIAQEGFVVSPALHNTLQYMRYLKTVEPAASLYFKKNNLNQLEPIKVGSVLTNQEFAKTLKRLSKHGAKDFYEGETAKAIIKTVNKSQDNSEILTLKDFKNYEIIWRDPLCIEYRKRSVCGMPPPAGNISVMMILKMLENYNVKSFKPTSPEFIHLYSEISALTYSDRNFFLADPDYINIPITGLLDQDYLQDRVKIINNTKSIRNPKPGQPDGYKKYSENVDISRDSTSHLVIVDLYGNAISMTSTIEGPFGSHLMVEGFMLNNELTDFSFLPDYDGIPIANRVEAGKRPLSSMSPTIIFDESGNIHSLTGSPGGTSIIGYVAKSILGLIDWDMSPQEAVDIPHYMRKKEETELEKGTELESHKIFLENIGHKVSIKRKRSGLHAAKKVEGGYIGGADSRREGLVIQIN